MAKRYHAKSAIPSAQCSTKDKVWDSSKSEPHLLVRAVGPSSVLLLARLYSLPRVHLVQMIVVDRGYLQQNSCGPALQVIAFWDEAISDWSCSTVRERDKETLSKDSH